MSLALISEALARRVPLAGCSSCVRRSRKSFPRGRTSWPSGRRRWWNTAYTLCRPHRPPPRKGPQLARTTKTVKTALVRSGTACRAEPLATRAPYSPIGFAAWPFNYHLTSPVLVRVYCASHSRLHFVFGFPILIFSGFVISPLTHLKS
jgi:hypothetical protein